MIYYSDCSYEFKFVFTYYKTRFCRHQTAARTPKHPNSERHNWASELLNALPADANLPKRKNTRTKTAQKTIFHVAIQVFGRHANLKKHSHDDVTQTLGNTLPHVQLLLEIDTLMFKTTGCIFYLVPVSHRMPASARHSVTAGGGVRDLYKCAGVCIAMVWISRNVACHFDGYTVCSYTGNQTGISNLRQDSSVSTTTMLPNGTHNKQSGRGVKLYAQSIECPNYECVELYLHSLTSSQHGARLSTRTASALAYNCHIVQRHLTFCLSTSPLFIVVSSNLRHRVVWYVAINGPTMTHYLHYHGILVALYSSEMLLLANQTAPCHNPSDYKHIHYRKHHTQTLKVCETSVTLYQEWRLQ